MLQQPPAGLTEEEREQRSESKGREEKEEKRRISTEPRVHLLRAAVLQQGLNQDVQVLFRRLLGELLLTRQTGGERRGEAGRRGGGKRQRRRERETQNERR